MTALIASVNRSARRAAGERNYESLALGAALASFVLCFFVGIIVFWGQEVSISGWGSLGEFLAIASAVGAFLAFIGARVLVHRAAAPRDRTASTERFHWFDIAALALVHATIALLGWIGLATVMESSFVGATLYTTPATVLAAAAAALSAYLAFLSGVSMSPRQLSLVLAVFLAVGVTSAMLSSSDPQWWQMNLSALGITHDISSLTFNLTVIISGVLVTTIARFGTSALPSSTPSEARRRFVVRLLFILIGVMLACVGIFPVDRFFLMHNTVATGMCVGYAVLVIGLPWLIPTMPKAFIALGYVYVVAIIVVAVLFAIGEYNLTAVELLASLMIFSWIIIFLRNSESLGPAPADQGETT